MAKVIFSAKQILAGHRGAVAIVVVILMFMFLGFAAFAVDFGYSYMVKNELQNAADAAALAGASVLFSHNTLCISSGSPYSCCTGLKTGSCNPSVVDSNNVVGTAQAVAAQNTSGGNQVPAPTVEIGHYTFAASRDTPGTFTATQNYQQMANWETLPFSTLNGRTDFLNAVKATVTRTDVPRFFSRIWSSSSLAITAEAVAYIGFAGTLPPGVVDAPIAVCKQSLITDPNCTSNCQYTCVNGRMINSGGGVTTNTGGWTNFTQDSCTTANPSNVPNSCSGLNPTLIFGQGMGTVGGQQTPVMNGIINCWKQKCASSPVTKPEDCTQPWRMQLPVIECPANNVSPCSKLVGTVELNLLWIWQNPDMEDSPRNMTIRNPLTGDVIKTWSSPASCDALPRCQGANDTSNCRGNCRWNSFVNAFNIQNAGGIPSIVGSGPNDLKPSQLATTIFFLPDCTPHAPQGGTGGENFGIQARYPVLVPYREVP